MFNDNSWSLMYSCERKRSSLVYRFTKICCISSSRMITKLQLPEEQVRKLDENQEIKISWRNNPVIFSCFDQNQSILMNGILNNMEILVSNWFFPPTCKTFFSPPQAVAFLLALAFPKSWKWNQTVWVCAEHVFPGAYRHSIILRRVLLGRFQHCMFLQHFQWQHLDMDHMATYRTLLRKAGWHFWLRLLSAKTAEPCSQNAHRWLSLLPDFSSQFKRNHSRVREFYS